MDEKFIRDRITQLRLRKGVSEYQMSYDLGHSRSYVYNISSGKSLHPCGSSLQSVTISRSRPSSFLMRVQKIQSWCKRPSLASVS